MGVTSLHLTEAGREFFPHAATTGTVNIQQHHRREVAKAGDSFIQLAQGNQVLLNEKGTILTLQAHPEKDAETAKLRMHDSTRWFGFDSVDEKSWAKLQSQIDMAHEGEAIWKRIFEWVREPGVEIMPLVARQVKM
jgi:hypothetical protein